MGSHLAPLVLVVVHDRALRNRRVHFVHQLKTTRGISMPEDQYQYPRPVSRRASQWLQWCCTQMLQPSAVHTLVKTAA